MDENQLKNRSMNRLPRKELSPHNIVSSNVCTGSTADSLRVSITSETQSDYICANYIDVSMK